MRLSWSSRTLLLSAVFAGLLIRLALIPNPGFEADVSFWKSWGLATVDFGAVEGLKVANNNYPTPFTYALGAMVWVYRLFADPHNFHDFWQNTNTLFLAVSKALPIIADIAIAGMFLFIGKNAAKLGFPTLSKRIGGLTVYELASAIWILSPISIIDGAWWGQVDSVGVCLFLVSLILLLSRRTFLAGFIFMVAMMTKLQNMIYGPLFFLFTWQLAGPTGLFQAAAGALTGFIGLNLEFFLTKNADRVLASLTENYDYFPWMSLNAYNLWWIVAGGRGMQVSDKLLSIGIANAKTVGLLLFSATYAFAALRQVFLMIHRVLSPDKKNRDTLNTQHLLRGYLEGLILVNGAFFLFQTQSHDRYAFPLAAFFLLWLPFFLSDAGKNKAQRALTAFFFLYGAYTVLYFYNLHTAFAINYPVNTIPLLNTLTGPTLTVATAFGLIGLFTLFVLYLLRRTGASRIAGYISTSLFFLGLLATNIPLITHSPVSLTKFTPYISQQDYGTRQKNRTVQSSFGTPYQWDRLSVQYQFYRKGIGTHANSTYVYDIGKKFRRFTTDVGIDTEAGKNASVAFSLYGDGALLFQSKTLGRFDLPQHIDVDVTGVRFLKLVTTDGGNGNFDDHADWLNPTLIP